MIILVPLDTKIVYAAAIIDDPRGFTLDRTGEYFYIASRNLHQIYKVKFGYKVYTAESVVGNGQAGKLTLHTQAIGRVRQRSL